MRKRRSLRRRLRRLTTYPNKRFHLGKAFPAFPFIVSSRPQDYTINVCELSPHETSYNVSNRLKMPFTMVIDNLVKGRYFFWGAVHPQKKQWTKRSIASLKRASRGEPSRRAPSRPKYARARTRTIELDYIVLGRDDERSEFLLQFRKKCVFLQCGSGRAESTGTAAVNMI